MDEFRKLFSGDPHRFVRKVMIQSMKLYSFISLERITSGTH
jgi:hypothetical protein